MSKSNYDDFVEAIEYREDLQKALDEINEEKKFLRSQIGYNSQSLVKYNREVSGYKATYERTKDKHAHADLNHSLKLRDETRDSLNVLNDNLLELQNQAEKIEKKLLSLDKPCPVKFMHEHKKEIEQAESEVKRFQELIDQQNVVLNKHEEIIQNSKTPSAQMEKLVHQKNEALVSLAEGNDQKKELDKIESEISELREKNNTIVNQSKKQVEQARLTISALQNKQAIPARELEYLKSLTPKILTMILKTKARQIAGEYEKSAKTLARSVLKLVAINKIINKAGIEPDSGVISTTSSWEIKVPWLNTAKDRKEHFSRFESAANFIDMINLSVEHIDGYENIEIQVMEELEKDGIIV